MGPYLFTLTAEEKTELIQEAQNRHRQQINEIYSHLNAKLENAGREPLQNPFN